MIRQNKIIVFQANNFYRVPVAVHVESFVLYSLLAYHDQYKVEQFFYLACSTYDLHGKSGPSIVTISLLLIER